MVGKQLHAENISNPELCKALVTLPELPVAFLLWAVIWPDLKNSRGINHEKCINREVQAVDRKGSRQCFSFWGH